MVRQKSILGLVQEPWCNENRVRGLGTAERVYVTMGEIVPRTCIVVRGIEAVGLQDYSTRELAVVSIRDDATVGGRSGQLIVESAYFAHGMEVSSLEVRRPVDFCKREGHGLIVGCDANAHSHVWGSTDDNQRGEEHLKYFLGTGIEILNEGTEPTFVTANKSKVLDITLCNQRLRRRLGEYKVSDEASLSNHRTIWATLIEVIPKVVWKRNPRNTVWPGF